MAALSYVFENGVEETVVRSAMTGFKKCAGISAHYGLSDVFDNIIVTLCKFTSLSDQSEVSGRMGGGCTYIVNAKYASSLQLSNTLFNELSL